MQRQALWKRLARRSTNRSSNDSRYWETRLFVNHLYQLTDEFVTEREGRYILTASAERVLRAVFAGSLSDHASFEGEPIDTVCQQCGEESVVIDYTETRLRKRCTNCVGQYDLSDQPSGLLAYFFRPPAGLVHQTPQEFFRTTNIWYWNRIRTIHQGVCPDCSGTISSMIAVCEDHQTADGQSFENCGSAFEVQPYFVCKICELVNSGDRQVPPLTDAAVMAFFYEHDLDPQKLYAESRTHVLHNAVEEVALESEEPPKVRVTYVIDGDGLQVTLDDETNVIDVSETIEG